MRPGAFFPLPFLAALLIAVALLVSQYQRYDRPRRRRRSRWAGTAPTRERRLSALQELVLVGLLIANLLVAALAMAR